MTPVAMAFASMAAGGKTSHEISWKKNVMNKTKMRLRWVSNIG